MLYILGLTKIHGLVLMCVSIIFLPDESFLLQEDTDQCLLILMNFSCNVCAILSSENASGQN